MGYLPTMIGVEAARAQANLLLKGRLHRIDTVASPGQFSHLRRLRGWHQKLLAEVSEGNYPEDPVEYRADNGFWVATEARWQTLDKHCLGELIDVIGTIGLGDAENHSKDILSRVYEYFVA